MDIGDGNPGARGAKLEAGGWRRTAAAAAWRRAHRTVILKSAMLSAHGQAVLWRQCELAGWWAGGWWAQGEDCGQYRPRVGAVFALVRRCRCLSGSATTTLQWGLKLAGGRPKPCC